MAKLGPEDIQAMVDSIMEETRAANENERLIAKRLEKMEKEREARAKNEEPWKPSGGSLSHHKDMWELNEEREKQAQVEGNKAQAKILAKAFYENLEKNVDCAQVWKPRDRAPGAEPCVEHVKLEDWCPPSDYDVCEITADEYVPVPPVKGINYWLGLASNGCKKTRDLNKELGGYAPQRAAEKKITELVVEAAKLYAGAMAELNLKGVLSWGWESDCVGMENVKPDWDTWLFGMMLVHRDRWNLPEAADCDLERFATFAAELDLPDRCEYAGATCVKCPLWKKNKYGCAYCPLYITKK